MRTISTHTKAWNVEKRMYGFGEIHLPKPIELMTLGFLLVGLLLGWLISQVPIMRAIPPVFRYVGLPIGLTYFMSKVKIHSKTPLRFVQSYLAYRRQPKSLIRFQPIKEQKPVRFDKTRRGI